MKKWTRDELELLAKFGSEARPIDVYQAYKDLFGENRSYDAVQKKMKSLWLDAEQAEEVAPVEPSEVVVEWAIRGRKNLTAKQKKEAREDLGVFIEQVIEDSDHYTIGIDHKNLPRGEGGSLVVLLSDTHLGKKTKVFDLEVAKERLLSIPEKIQFEIQINDIEEVVFVLAGDMVEGEDIYPTQAHHIECPVLDQVQATVSTLFKLGKKTRDLLDVEVRFETCPGNHGRISKSANEKSNWDNCIYQTLGMLAEVHGDPSLRVNVNFNTFHTFPVRDKKGMIFHHGTKHVGTPAMQKKHAGWIYTKGHDFMLHGHWHQWEVGTFLGRPIMKNGSLCGEDDLAERMGVFDPARQGWLLIREGQPINTLGFFEWEAEVLDIGVGAAPGGYGENFSPSSERG